MAAQTVPKDYKPEYQEIPGYSITFDQNEGSRVLLGSGGFGVVYRGKYDKLGDVKVAIKQILNTQYGIRPKDLELLKKEARHMYQVRHPDILTIYGLVCDDSKKDNQLFAIITEYMERGSLEDLMEKIKVPWSVKVKMLQDVSAGLTYLCHKQNDRPYEIIHGDIKAANILIDIHFKAKISDFGTSKLQGITSKTTKVPFKCTVTHVAPEVLNVSTDDYGRPDELSRPSEMSDVYSLGITIFEVCAENGGKEDHPLYRVPFPSGLTEEQLYAFIRRDMKSLFTPMQKEKIPADCPEFLHELSKSCGKVNPKERPKMRDVQSILQEKFDSEFRQKYDKAMSKLFHNTDADENIPDLDTIYQVTPVNDASMPEVSPNVDTVDKGGVAKPSASSYNQSTTAPNLKKFMESLSQRVEKLEREQKIKTTSQRTVEIKRIKEQMHQLGVKQNQGFSAIQNQLKNQPTKEDLNNVQTNLHSAFSHRQSVIKKHFPYLLDNMDDPVSISDYLYSWDVIDLDGIDTIKSGVTRRDKVRKLLELVDNKGQGGIDNLSKALEETGQSYICDQLKQRYRMTQLQQNYQVMIDYLRPDRVIVILYSREVINRDQKEILSAEVTTSGKVGKLLDIIDNGGQAALNIFIQALDETEQKELADRLR